MRYDSKMGIWRIDLDAPTQPAPREPVKDVATPVSGSTNNNSALKQQDQVAPKEEYPKRLASAFDMQDRLLERMTGKSEDADTKLQNETVTPPKNVNFDLQGDSLDRRPTQGSNQRSNLHLHGSQAKSSYQQAHATTWESRYVQLMILLAAGDIRSCKQNALEIYTRYNQQREAILANEKAHTSQAQQSQLGSKWGKQETYVFVNIALLLVKCLLVESSEEAIRRSAAEKLQQCLRVLKDGFGIDMNSMKEIKARMVQLQKDKQQNQDDKNMDEKSSNLTSNRLSKLKRQKQIDFNDFRWYLTSLGVIASYFNSMGFQKQCEEVYVKYVGLVEDFFAKDSMEAGNAYFMVGIYYYEQEQFQKSLACFIKSHYIRRKELGPHSLGVADCHMNMGVVYRKLGFGRRALEHYETALKIRRDLVGPLSLPVAAILEQIGKYHIEESTNFEAAYRHLQEALSIRARLLGGSEHPDVMRVQVLLLYLHQKIKNELDTQKSRLKIADQAAGKVAPANGAKLLEISFDIVSTIEEEVAGHVNPKFKESSSAMPFNLENLVNGFEQKRLAEMCPSEDGDFLKDNQFFSSPPKTPASEPAQEEVPLEEDAAAKAREKFTKNMFKQRYQEHVETFKKKQAQEESLVDSEAFEDSYINDQGQTVEDMLACGMNQYLATVQQRVVESSKVSLSSFVMSLTEAQLSYLHSQQTSFEEEDIFEIPSKFVSEQLTKDVVQMSLYKASCIWKLRRKEFLDNCNLPLSVFNLKNLTEGVSPIQKRKDQNFISMIRQVPQFLETLLPAQQRIFFQVVENELPLKYFFISIHEKQLTDFENVHYALAGDAERRAALEKLSREFPDKLVISAKDIKVDQE